MSLPESLERAASENPSLADQIRPANGDPDRLLDELSTEDAGQLLAWILKEEPDVAAELIEVWGESEEGAQVLLSVSDVGIAKSARKALRRAHHRLRSRGIEVVITASPAKATSARRAANTSDRWQEAHLSAPDFRGARVGYLVESHPSGGARLFEIRFDPARGILDFKIYNAGRSKVRGFLRSLTGGVEQRLFEVDRGTLRALVRRASRGQPADRPLPSSFVEWRGRLFAEDLDEEATPGELVRRALASKATSVDSAARVETTLREIRDGSLGPWPPKTAWVADWMERGREAVEGLEGEARSGAIDRWLGESTEALSKETDVELLAHHLEEMAWIRWRSDAETGALALLDVSEAIAGNDDALNRMSRARVEGLFAAFLVELRVVEEDALESAETDATSD